MLGTAITHETVDLQVLFEGEVERKRGEEDDRLDVVEEWYPVLALLFVVAGYCTHHPHPRESMTITLRQIHEIWIREGTYTAATSTNVVNVPLRSRKRTTFHGEMVLFDTERPHSRTNDIICSQF